MEITPRENSGGQKDEGEIEIHEFSCCIFFQSIISKYSKGTASLPFEKKTSKSKSQAL